MSSYHRAIAVFVVGGLFALAIDRFLEKPIDSLEKKVEDAIDG